MNRQKLRGTLIDLGKDLLTAFAIVAIVMLALFAYSGIWPPMVVVESGSMQRYDDRSVVGVIDTGDMVFVKKVGGPDSLVTYVEGEATGYSRYGTYGDVIIYRPNGLEERPDGSKVVPIIHRLVVWLELNSTGVDPDHAGVDYANYTFDVPSLGLRDTTDDVVLHGYGFWKETVRISLAEVLGGFASAGVEPHAGYITMGDHNVPFYDQPSYLPVRPDWIVGKAWGEVPWFGLIKLRVTGANLQQVPGNSWTNLIITVIVVLSVPLALDFLLPRFRKRREGSAKAKAGQADVPDAPAEGVAPDASVPDPPEDGKADAVAGNDLDK